MNLTPYFKSIIDQDVASVVICNLKHEIIYMNPKAVESYHKWGGEALLGKSLMNCHNPKSKEIIEKVVAWFEEDKEHNGEKFSRGNRRDRSCPSPCPRHA